MSPQSLPSLLGNIDIRSGLRKALWYQSAIVRGKGGEILASREILSALAVPNFRWLWIGSLGSSFAMNMQIIARGWLVYSLTSSAVDLAWVTLSFMLPSVLFSLYGGVLADRLPKRKIIVYAQSLNCLATLIMAGIIFDERVSFGILSGSVFLTEPSWLCLCPPGKPLFPS